MHLHATVVTVLLHIYIIKENLIAIPFHLIHPPLCFFVYATPWTICMRIMCVSALVDDRMKVLRRIFEILLGRLHKILIISYMNLAFKYSIIRYEAVNQRFIVT